MPAKATEKRRVQDLQRQWATPVPRVRPGRLTARADRREARKVPTRRTLIQVFRQRHADAGSGDPESISPNRGEAVVDLTYYRAVERK